MDRSYDQSNKIYSINKQIRFKTSMLQSNLCDYNDVFIVSKGTISVTRPNVNVCDKK